MNRRTGRILLALGLLMLLLGLVIPTTSTETSTSCYDDPFGPGQDCVETEYESVNSSKFVLLGLGTFATVIGGIGFYSGPSGGTRRSVTQNEPRRGWDGGSLEEQLREHQRNKKK
ncbi:hypothetical protein SAMN04487967_0660 [Natronorubrum sediminis]|uniref:Transmembrane protein n=1 Tax=Natronorubrum sediminis TaxID=640943 RepID=A0A1H6FQU9_9EURY|nr:hypothetical protein [Natronorubrum sediminis]SEH12115.1 hypothetical protein SAMN04487967_0660 [Natronorubrum sediminis]